MKSFLSAWIALLILLIGSCQNDDPIGPSDLLYKRWHLSQFKREGENSWIVDDADAYYDTEYQSNGTLIYRKNGVLTSSGCCIGNRFERNGEVIQYTDFPTCPTVKCAANANATITILKDNLLELQLGDLISQYTPAD